MKVPPPLEARIRALKLYGLLAHWSEVQHQPWLPELLDWEEQSRAHRGLERRLRQARLGTFKPLADFDWTWPKKIDRTQMDDLFRLQWLEDATNVVLVGPNGIGKTLLAKNLVHQAVVQGVTARFLTASELLNTLVEQESAAALRRKIAFFTRPQLLAIDELGYLSYDTRYADLLFEVVSRRYEHKSLLLTTNKPFAAWGEVFPNATSVVTLVDRLVHRCEIVSIEGESYRLKESKQQARQRAQQRATGKRRS
jgi:DNA replication protein DnaC